MNYPKVKYFLSHVVTSTEVLIIDDISDYVYYDGKIKDYMDSDISLENLTLIQSYIRNNVLNVRALKDYNKN